MIPRTTAKDISDQLIADFEAYLGTTFPDYPKSFIRTLTKAMAGLYVLGYESGLSYLEQMFVKTAANVPISINGKTLNPLQEHGSLLGLTQGTGVSTELSIQISVITTGGTIESGERIVNPDTGIIYVVVGDVSLSSSSVAATIRSTVSGENANVILPDDENKLYFVSPRGDVEKSVFINSQTVSGSDPQTTEEFRDEILQRWLARPQGGAYADYLLWAKEASDNVKNAYVYSGWGDDAIPSSRTGQVFIYIESVSDTDGIPLQALLDDVYDYIEGDPDLSTRRPVNAYVQVLPITRSEVDVTISGLSTDDDTNCKIAIEAAITDFFLALNPAGQSGYTLRPPKNDIISKNNLGGLIAGIASGYNGTITSVTFEVHGETPEAYSMQEGEKAKVGTVTWL